MNYEKKSKAIETRTDELLIDIRRCIDLLGNETKRKAEGITTDDIFVDFTSSLVALVHLTGEERKLKAAFH